MIPWDNMNEKDYRGFMEYILEFIDSNTVYKHLMDIGYKPDTLTAAYIVWQSKSNTLAEKEEAFEWIINNMPDMHIPAHIYHSEWESLHQFLKEYNRLISKLIKSFEASEYGAVYNFSVYYGAPDNEWVDDEVLYSSFEGVMDAVKDELEDKELRKLKRIRIRRRVLDLRFVCDYLSLTPDMEYYSLDMGTVMPSEDYEVLHLFENLCLPIPHPFKKGDIIKECAGKYALPTYYNDTLVVTDYHSKEYVCENAHTLGMHDYTLYGICSDGEGRTYEDSINHYLNAEIIEPGEVLIKDCVLLKESRKIKGEN